MAIPYGVTIDVAYGRERFVRGAFAEQVGSVNRWGTPRVSHSATVLTVGFPLVLSISCRSEATDSILPETFWMCLNGHRHARQIGAGLNGVSVEFVPGKFRRKADVVEHYAGVRLAGVAGSYAPAYREARVALRSVARATEGKARMPALSASALTERRDALTRQVATIRSLAEAEDRALDESETGEIDTLNTRLANVTALITDAESESQRRDAERRSLPQQCRSRFWNRPDSQRNRLWSGPGNVLLR